MLSNSWFIRRVRLTHGVDVVKQLVHTESATYPWSRCCQTVGAYGECDLPMEQMLSNSWCIRRVRLTHGVDVVKQLVHTESATYPWSRCCQTVGAYGECDLPME